MKKLILSGLVVLALVGNGWGWHEIEWNGTPPLTYDGEAFRFTTSATPQTAVAIPVTTTIPAGKFIVVTSSSTGGCFSSVVDSKGNTWTVGYGGLGDSGTYTTIASCRVTTELGNGDTITGTYGPSASRSEVGAVQQFSGGVGSNDITAPRAYAYGTAISIPGTAVNAGACAVGVISARVGNSYSNSQWDVVGAALIAVNSYPYYIVKKCGMAPGVQNPSGSLASNGNWGGVWVSYY